MIAWFRQRLAARRRRRLERMADEYGDYSEEGRREIEKIRADHDPLDELARSRTPGGANLGHWNESDLGR